MNKGYLPSDEEKSISHLIKDLDTSNLEASEAYLKGINLSQMIEDVVSYDTGSQPYFERVQDLLRKSPSDSLYGSGSGDLAGKKGNNESSSYILPILASYVIESFNQMSPEIDSSDNGRPLTSHEITDIVRDASKALIYLLTTPGYITENPMTAKEGNEDAHYNLGKILENSAYNKDNLRNAIPFENVCDPKEPNPFKESIDMMVSYK